ncbi:TRAF1A [Scenedesmus sp. PABB004]|nr:TRAF1A [Scenedesmus sp. PABB004]
MASRALRELAGPVVGAKGPPAADGVLSVTPDPEAWTAPSPLAELGAGSAFLDEDDAPQPGALFGRFTWRISGFTDSKKNQREIRSSQFAIGDYKWYILVYPQGCDVCNHLSLFLCVADYDKLLPGWSHFAQFTIAVVNKDPKKSKYSDTLHRFCKKEHDWGWKKFMELSKVLDGFTVADTLVIKAQVQVILDKPGRPFRCLDASYRRELVRVYLSNVESICRRFCEEKRAALAWLRDEAAAFNAWWRSLPAARRAELTSVRGDAILKGLVKQFFNEKEVTSTLVMDALFCGAKQLDAAAPAPAAPSAAPAAPEGGAPAPAAPCVVINARSGTFGFALDALEVAGQLGAEFIPHYAGRDDKALPLGADGLGLRSGGDELSELRRDALERDERRLAELGRRTVEMYALAHIIATQLERAYRDHLAELRMQRLIAEEEAAAAAHDEAAAARAAADKERRAKKKERKKAKKEADRVRREAAEAAEAAERSKAEEERRAAAERKRQQQEEQEAAAAVQQAPGQQQQLPPVPVLQQQRQQQQQQQQQPGEQLEQQQRPGEEPSQLPEAQPSQAQPGKAALAAGRAAKAEAHHALANGSDMQEPGGRDQQRATAPPADRDGSRLGGDAAAAGRGAHSSGSTPGSAAGGSAADSGSSSDSGSEAGDSSQGFEPVRRHGGQREQRELQQQPRGRAGHASRHAAQPQPAPNPPAQAHGAGGWGATHNVHSQQPAAPHGGSGGGSNGSSSNGAGGAPARGSIPTGYAAALAGMKPPPPAEATAAAAAMAEQQRRVRQLEDALAGLRGTVAALREAGAAKDAALAACEQEAAELRAQVAGQAQQIAELRRQAAELRAAAARGGDAAPASGARPLLAGGEGAAGGQAAARAALAAGGAAVPPGGVAAVLDGGGEPLSNRSSSSAAEAAPPDGLSSRAVGGPVSYAGAVGRPGAVAAASGGDGAAAAAPGSRSSSGGGGGGGVAAAGASFANGTLAAAGAGPAALSGNGALASEGAAGGGGGAALAPLARSVSAGVAGPGPSGGRAGASADGADTPTSSSGSGGGGAAASGLGGAGAGDGGMLPGLAPRAPGSGGYLGAGGVLDAPPFHAGVLAPGGPTSGAKGKLPGGPPHPFGGFGGQIAPGAGGGVPFGALPGDAAKPQGGGPGSGGGGRPSASMLEDAALEGFVHMGMIHDLLTE